MISTEAAKPINTEISAFLKGSAEKQHLRIDTKDSTSQIRPHQMEFVNLTRILEGLLMQWKSPFESHIVEANGELTKSTFLCAPVLLDEYKDVLRTYMAVQKVAGRSNREAKYMLRSLRKAYKEVDAALAIYLGANNKAQYTYQILKADKVHRTLPHLFTELSKFEEFNRARNTFATLKSLFDTNKGRSISTKDARSLLVSNGKRNFGPATLPKTGTCLLIDTRDKTFTLGQPVHHPKASFVLSVPTTYSYSAAMRAASVDPSVDVFQPISGVISETELYMRLEDFADRKNELDVLAGFAKAGVRQALNDKTEMVESMERFANHLSPIDYESNEPLIAVEGKYAYFGVQVRGKVYQAAVQFKTEEDAKSFLDGDCPGAEELQEDIEDDLSEPFEG